MSAAVAHAADLLTAPLRDDPTTRRLRSALLRTLSTPCCLSLSPARPPPRPLLAAAHAARMRWSAWIAALGGADIELRVEEGAVFVDGRCVWSDDEDIFDDIAQVVKWMADPPSEFFIYAPPPPPPTYFHIPSFPSYGDSSASSSSSLSSSPISSPRSSPVPLPRTRSRHRVRVDTTRAAVTTYDGGKVGVVTGGVLLGKRRPRVA